MSLLELFRVPFVMRDRASFASLACHSVYIEQTFRRYFQKTLN